MAADDAAAELSASIGDMSEDVASQSGSARSGSGEAASDAGSHSDAGEEGSGSSSGSEGSSSGDSSEGGSEISIDDQRFVVIRLDSTTTNAEGGPSMNDQQIIDLLKKAKKKSRKSTKKGKSSKSNKKKKADKEGSAAAAPAGSKAVKPLKPAKLKKMAPEDAAYTPITTHFMAHHARTTAVQNVLSVSQPPLQKKFDAYRKQLAKAHPELDQEGLLVVRAYHGTMAVCNIGLDGNAKPCDNAECRVCQILTQGFDLSKAGTGGRKHRDLAPPAGSTDPYPNRFGAGLYFCLSAAEAQQYSTCFPSKLGLRKRAVTLACQVAVGHSQPLWAPETGLKAAPDGFDSVIGMPADAAHPDSTLRSPEVVVYNASAALVRQVIVYSHANEVCTACGRQTDFKESIGIRIVNAYGPFCDETCRSTYTNTLLVDYERQVKNTPEVKDPFKVPVWTKTDGDDNLVLVRLVPNSAEYNVVLKQFIETVPNIEIKKIHRVQNKHLWAKYYAEKEAMRKKSSTGEANEMLLFHGTGANDPSGIYYGEEGFDCRFARTTGFWGTGSYFASKATYSHHYSFLETEPDGRATGYNTMFLAKVVLGDAYDYGEQQDNSLKMPPVKKIEEVSEVSRMDGDDLASTSKGTKKGSKGTAAKKKKKVLYDSVTGITFDTRVFIVYSAAKAYPGYLVTYRIP